MKDAYNRDRGVVHGAGIANKVKVNPTGSRSEVFENEDPAPFSSTSNGSGARRFWPARPRRAKSARRVRTESDAPPPALFGICVGMRWR